MLLAALSMLTATAQTVAPVPGEGGNKYIPMEDRTGNQSIVYFTRKLSAEGLIAAYEQVCGNIKGKVGVKLHTGEQQGPNILPREWVKALLAKDLPDANIVETNTYYNGDRYTTAEHRKTLKINGWNFCPVDIMDENDTTSLPVIGGKWFTKMSVGKNPKNMADIRWRIAIPDSIDRDSGIYFLRTNVGKLDEKTTWDYYNLTREIECTNRQLKTDLNLRPIHHKKDDRSDAHLFFGLLAYWIVNTIRYKLKQKGYNSYWTEIVRVMKTQKAITTEGTNALGEKVHLRLCSEPNKSATQIYEMLNYKKMPFRRIKIENKSL